MRLARFVTTVFVVALVIGLFRWESHWLAIHMGLVKAGPDPFYNFWSGFGSDLGYASVLVGVVGAWRHHNCHVVRCPWLGKPVKGSPYLACPKHHPAHEGDKRGVSVETIHKAHDERTRR